MSAGGGYIGNGSTYCEACSRTYMNKHMKRHVKCMAHVKAEAALPTCCRCSVKTRGWSDDSGRIYCQACYNAKRLEDITECVGCREKTLTNRCYDDLGSSEVGKVFCEKCHSKERVKRVAGRPEDMAAFVLQLLDRVSKLEMQVRDLENCADW